MCPENQTCLMLHGLRDILQIPDFAEWKGSLSAVNKENVIKKWTAFCKNPETAILFQPFEEMNPEEISKLRRLNNHCYLLDELFEILKVAFNKEQGKKPHILDPLTRQIWSDAVIDA